MAEIKSNGLYQKDLITFLDNVLTLMTEVKSDFNAVLTKLDGDTLVNDTNYNSTGAITATVPTRPATLRADGIYQGELFTLLSGMATFSANTKTKADALLAKLDADGGAGGVIGTNYAALHTTSSAVPSVADISALGLGNAKAILFVLAMNTFLNELKTDYGALLVKLDNDTGVTLTTYASGNPIAATLSTTV